MKTSEEGIHRAFARDQAICFAQSAREFEPVAVLIAQEGKDAVLDRTSSHLG